MNKEIKKELAELRELLATATTLMKGLHAQNKKYRKALTTISERVCETDRERQMRKTAEDALKAE